MTFFAIEALHAFTYIQGSSAPLGCPPKVSLVYATTAGQGSNSTMRVKEDRNGAVVDGMNIHSRTEQAGLDITRGLISKFGHKGFEEELGLGRFHGCAHIRPVPLPVSAVHER